MELILSEEPSTKDCNLQLEPPLLGVGTLVDVLGGGVFIS